MLYDPYYARVLAAAGARIVHEMPADAEATLVLDTTGGAALVEFSISDAAYIKADTAVWAPARGLGQNGVVSSATIIDTIPSAITAVRVTNQGATPVILEVRQ